MQSKVVISVFSSPYALNSFLFVNNFDDPDDDTRYDVDFPNSDHVRYDRDRPSMTWLTPTGIGTFYFNSNTISFELDETLGIGDDDTPLSNTIKFFGSDNNSEGRFFIISSTDGICLYRS